MGFAFWIYFIIISLCVIIAKILPRILVLFARVTDKHIELDNGVVISLSFRLGRSMSLRFFHDHWICIRLRGAWIKIVLIGYKNNHGNNSQNKNTSVNVLPLTVAKFLASPFLEWISLHLIDCTVITEDNQGYVSKLSELSIRGTFAQIVSVGEQRVRARILVSPFKYCISLSENNESINISTAPLIITTSVAVSSAHPEVMTPDFLIANTHVQFQWDGADVSINLDNVHLIIQHFNELKRKIFNQSVDSNNDNDDNNSSKSNDYITHKTYPAYMEASLEMLRIKLISNNNPTLHINLTDACIRATAHGCDNIRFLDADKRVAKILQILGRRPLTAPIFETSQLLSILAIRGHVGGLEAFLTYQNVRGVLLGVHRPLSYGFDAFFDTNENNYTSSNSHIPYPMYPDSYMPNMPLDAQLDACKQIESSLDYFANRVFLRLPEVSLIWSPLIKQWIQYIQECPTLKIINQLSSNSHHNGTSSSDKLDSLIVFPRLEISIQIHSILIGVCSKECSVIVPASELLVDLISFQLKSVNFELTCINSGIKSNWIRLIRCYADHCGIRCDQSVFKKHDLIRSGPFSSTLIVSSTNSPSKKKLLTIDINSVIHLANFFCSIPLKLYQTVEEVVNLLTIKRHTVNSHDHVRTSKDTKEKSFYINFDVIYHLDHVSIGSLGVSNKQLSIADRQAVIIMDSFILNISKCEQIQPTINTMQAKNLKLMCSDIVESIDCTLCLIKAQRIVSEIESDKKAKNNSNEDNSESSYSCDENSVSEENNLSDESSISESMSRKLVVIVDVFDVNIDFIKLMSIYHVISNIEFQNQAIKNIDFISSYSHQNNNINESNQQPIEALSGNDKNLKNMKEIIFNGIILKEASLNFNFCCDIEDKNIMKKNHETNVMIPNENRKSWLSISSTNARCKRDLHSWELDNGAMKFNNVPILDWDYVQIFFRDGVIEEDDLDLTFNNVNLNLPDLFLFGDILDSMLLHWKAYKKWKVLQQQAAKSEHISRFEDNDSGPEGLSIGDLNIEAVQFNVNLHDSKQHMARTTAYWKKLEVYHRVHQLLIHMIYSNPDVFQNILEKVLPLMYLNNGGYRDEIPKFNNLEEIDTMLMNILQQTSPSENLCTLLFTEFSFQLSLNDFPELYDKNNLVKQIALLDTVDSTIAPYINIDNTYDIYSFGELWGRRLLCSASDVNVKLRQYTIPLVTAGNLRVFGTVIVAQLKCPPLFTNDVLVNLDHRDHSKVFMKLQRTNSVPIKFYHDIEIYMDECSFGYGVCWQPVLSSLSDAFVRFSTSLPTIFGDLSISKYGKLPPSLTWWDNLRYKIHGKLLFIANRCTIRLLAGELPRDTDCLEIDAESLQIKYSRQCFILNATSVTASVIKIAPEATAIVHYLRARGKILVSRLPIFKPIDAIESDETDDISNVDIPSVNGTLLQVDKLQCRIDLNWKTEEPSTHYLHHLLSQKLLLENVFSSKFDNENEIYNDTIFSNNNNNRLDDSINNKNKNENSVDITQKKSPKVVISSASSCDLVRKLPPLIIDDNNDKDTISKLVENSTKSLPPHRLVLETFRSTGLKFDIKVVLRPKEIQNNNNKIGCPNFSIRYLSIHWLWNLYLLYIEPPEELIVANHDSKYQYTNTQSFGNLIDDMELEISCYLPCVELVHLIGTNPMGIRLTAEMWAFDCSMIVKDVPKVGGQPSRVWEVVDTSSDVVTFNGEILIPKAFSSKTHKNNESKSSRSNSVMSVESSSIPLVEVDEDGSMLMGSSSLKRPVRSRRRQSSLFDISRKSSLILNHNILDAGSYFKNFMDENGRYISPFIHGQNDRCSEDVFSCALFTYRTSTSLLQKMIDDDLKEAKSLKRQLSAELCEAPTPPPFPMTLRVPSVRIDSWAGQVLEDAPASLSSDDNLSQKHSSILSNNKKSFKSRKRELSLGMLENVGEDVSPISLSPVDNEDSSSLQHQRKYSLPSGFGAPDISENRVKSWKKRRLSLTMGRSGTLLHLPPSPLNSVNVISSNGNRTTIDSDQDDSTNKNKDDSTNKNKDDNNDNQIPKYEMPSFLLDNDHKSSKKQTSNDSEAYRFTVLSLKLLWTLSIRTEVDEWIELWWQWWNADQLNNEQLSNRTKQKATAKHDENSKNPSTLSTSTQNRKNSLKHQNSNSSVGASLSSHDMMAFLHRVDEVGTIKTSVMSPTYSTRSNRVASISSNDSGETANTKSPILEAAETMDQEEMSQRSYVWDFYRPQVNFQSNETNSRLVLTSTRARVEGYSWPFLYDQIMDQLWTENPDEWPDLAKDINPQSPPSSSNGNSEVYRFSNYSNLSDRNLNSPNSSPSLSPKSPRDHNAMRNSSIGQLLVEQRIRRRSSSQRSLNINHDRTFERIGYFGLTPYKKEITATLVGASAFVAPLDIDLRQAVMWIPSAVFKEDEAEIRRKASDIPLKRSEELFSNNTRTKRNSLLSKTITTSTGNVMRRIAKPTTLFFSYTYDVDTNAAFTSQAYAVASHYINSRSKLFAPVFPRASPVSTIHRQDSVVSSGPLTNAIAFFSKQLENVYIDSLSKKLSSGFNANESLDHVDSETKKRILTTATRLYLPQLDASTDSREFKTLIDVIISLLLVSFYEEDENKTMPKPPSDQQEFKKLVEMSYERNRKNGINETSSLEHVVEYCVRDLKWEMKLPGQDTTFVESTLTDFDGRHDYRVDGSQISLLQAGQLEVLTCLDETNKKHLVRPNLPLWNQRDARRDVMARVRMEQSAPSTDPQLANVILYEHFEVSVFPLVIVLPHKYYELLWEFFFPDNTVSSSDDADIQSLLPVKNFKNDERSFNSISRRSLLEEEKVESKTLIADGDQIRKCDVPYTNYFKYFRFSNIDVFLSYSGGMIDITNTRFNIKPFVINRSLLTWTEAFTNAASHMSKTVLWQSKKIIFGSEEREDTESDADSALKKVLRVFKSKNKEAPLHDAKASILLGLERSPSKANLDTKNSSID